MNRQQTAPALHQTNAAPDLPATAPVADPFFPLGHAIASSEWLSPEIPIGTGEVVGGAAFEHVEDTEVSK